MKEAYTGKIFSIRQFVVIVDKAIGSMMAFRKEIKLLDRNFRSHIMLAVTRVNGCKYCSYVHTRHALESGSSEAEIASLLEGDLGAVDNAQGPALLFAQHYADVSGDYDQASYNKIKEHYGADKAKGILAVVRMIMLGNAHGGTMSLLEDRLKGRRNKDSVFAGELLIFFGIIPLLPLVIVKNLLSRPAA